MPAPWRAVVRRRRCARSSGSPLTSARGSSCRRRVLRARRSPGRWRSRRGHSSPGDHAPRARRLLAVTESRVKSTLNANAEEPWYRSKANALQPQAWSADGDFIVFQEIAEKTQWDLWVMASRGDRTPKPYATTGSNETW